MIDIDNAKRVFLEYVRKYDITNGRIRLKMEHILHVADNSKMIAQNIGLDNEKVKLAELIGLFHDIGRFEQARVYDTFSDKDSGVDHAAYSLKVLYDDGLIKEFIDTDEYDEIIKAAVYNHNKGKIDEKVEGEALLFSKIIRDADKLDIYRVINEDAMIDIFWYKDFSNQDINDGIFKHFIENKYIDYKEIQNNADQILAFYNYIYDFNFPYCLKIIKEKKYLDLFYDRVVETFNNESISIKTKQILDMCNEFIDEKIKNI